MTEIKASCICAKFFLIFSLFSSASYASPEWKNQHDFDLEKADLYSVLNRITWGVNSSTYKEAKSIGVNQYVDQQLHPGRDELPIEIQSQIDAMTISQRPVDQLLIELEQRRKKVDSILKSTVSDNEKKTAQLAYQNELNRLEREAASRSLLRDVYSRNQLLEHMTWFWMNHFNIFPGKNNLHAMVGDYEDKAIRPHSLGKFRDLLAAAVFHPAMLRYLDNDQNAANHINENYAREILELHTLGVDAGYTQRDVQEFARILTGVGVNFERGTPTVKRELQNQYVRRGVFEFNPNRHDYGNKVFFGKVILGQGLAEVNEVLDILSRHPATAHFISQKLAAYFIGDNPPAALVKRMTNTFIQTDGQIDATLATLFKAPEFRQSLGHVFKDPIHYVVSSIRLAYDRKPILNTTPMVKWLYRMGESLYGRQTPDGYALSSIFWFSSGQMMTRFEIGKAIGSGSAFLFNPEGQQAQEHSAFPQLANALYYEVLQNSLSQTTQQALEKATSSQEWNTFLLSSPEFMHR